jgi:hypothetical protein
MSATSAPGIRLESVRRNSGGRIHLTPRVPKKGPVPTLCGQTLDAGSYAGVDTAADCANCIRRSRDASRISSAFFEQEEGSELLRLSLEQARFRNPPPGPSLPAERESVVVLPACPTWRAHDRRLWYRRTVWRSPAGVIVRMSGKGREHFAELVFEGAIIATRLEAGVRLHAGDVEVTTTGREVQVRIKRP